MKIQSSNVGVFWEQQKHEVSTDPNRKQVSETLVSFETIKLHLPKSSLSLFSKIVFLSK